jgi:large subunit ribosomal protein L31e
LGEKPQETVEREEIQTEEPETIETATVTEAEEEEIEEEAPSRRVEEREKEFVEERIYTVGLGRAWIKPPKKRAPKAVRIIRAFVQRHMKVEELPFGEEEEEEEGGRIIISNEVNEKIWRRGIEKPPRKLRIRAAKDEEGNVTVFLA